MAAFREGRVIETLEERPDLVRVRVALASGEVEAVGFPAMLGPVAPGDRIVVNTTGLELSLGTGGIGFILWNLDGGGERGPGAGHIVKLRYTPWQTEVLAVEAPESDHHEQLMEACSLGGAPVVACCLHSQAPAAAAGIKAAAEGARVALLVTDGAALPLAWSRLVRRSKEAGLVDVTCTAGHAFGGDLEAVNVFSGLAALRTVANADAIVVAMGPGGVGTGTALGFTAIEQGQVLDAATALGGKPVAALRISFVDRRERHRGVSHHSLTALTLAARERCTVALPVLAEPRGAQVRQQLTAGGLDERHDVVEADGAPGVDLMTARGVMPSSMGRRLDDTPEVFLAAAAAGALAATHLL
jgi:hypothetical protein